MDVDDARGIRALADQLVLDPLDRVIQVIEHRGLAPSEPIGEVRHAAQYQAAAAFSERCREGIAEAAGRLVNLGHMSQIDDHVARRWDGIRDQPQAPLDGGEVQVALQLNCECLVPALRQDGAPGHPFGHALTAKVRA